jgi:DNA repair exonuclease SbcCD ATPase subunit
MSQGAKVTSIQTVERFKEVLCEFGVDGQDALSAVDLQLRRAHDWLKQKAQYWQKEIRERHDALLKAKIELDQRKYENRDGRGRGTSEPEKNLRRAQERLKEAEQKLANCKKWAPQFEHALREYQGPARVLSGSLETDLKMAVALLNQKLEALDAYLKLNPPPTSAPIGTESAAEPAAVASQVPETPPPPNADAGADAPVEAAQPSTGGQA